MARPAFKRLITRVIPDRGLLLVKEHFKADVWPGEMPPTREQLIEEGARAMRAGKAAQRARGR